MMMKTNMTNATRNYFDGKWQSHPRLVKQGQLESQ